MAQRTSEFAIRFAMGACVRDISRLVLVSGVKLAVIGSALGLFGAVGISRFFASRFHNMHFGNPLLFIGTAALLINIALVASWVPARRAARINPIEALRAE